MLLPDIKDGPLPAQILERHYQALHGALPKAYLAAKAKLEANGYEGDSRAKT